jgi:hypothetical protein
VKRLAITTALLLAALVPPPAAAMAGASITGPGGLHFGDTATVSFDAGHARVDAFNWWARVDCEAGYAEYLHLGEQAGYPINDNLATFGPTFSWTGGGSECSVTLLAYDGNGRFVAYASDDFAVLP